MTGHVALRVADARLHRDRDTLHAVDRIALQVALLVGIERLRVPGFVGRAAQQLVLARRDET